MVENITNFKNWLIVHNQSTTIYADRLREFLNNGQDITEDNINTYIVAKKAENLAEETLNGYIKAIHAYLRFTKQDNIKLNYFEVPYKFVDFITLEFLEEQIIPLIPDLFNTSKHLQVKTVLYFMFYSGLRKSEVENLQRKNFDFPNKQLNAYIAKQKTERLLPLNNRIIEIVNIYFNSILETKNAFNIAKGGIDYIFSLLKPNFPDIKLRPHLLRHSYAMHLQRNGFSTKEIQYMLGHKNIITTSRYERADDRLIREKFNKNIK